jgi:hypothetical protein
MSKGAVLRPPLCYCVRIAIGFLSLRPINSTQVMVISEIQSDLEAVERGEHLYEEKNFDSRMEALDFIDVHIIDRIDGLDQNSELKKDLETLRLRVDKLKNELEEINTNLFRRLREGIKSGIYKGASFMKIVGCYVSHNVQDTDRQNKIGYDNLDILMNGLLPEQAIPVATLERQEEMIFYQKTPARIILQMIEMAQLGPDDVFYDIGSGLGQVAILTNLIGGAKVVGIEYEHAYCTYARVCATQLSLSNVNFINTDARDWGYADGAVFFTYSPFKGKMLDGMLEVLQKVSQKRTIRIFTYGPCSAHVARQSWLACTDGDGNDQYKLYEFNNMRETGIL